MKGEKKIILSFENLSKKCFGLAFIIVSLFFYANTWGQNQEIDELKAKLDPAQKSPTQVKVLNDLCKALSSFNAKEAQSYGEKAEKLAQEINFQEGLADAFTYLGNLQAFQFKRPDRASDYHDKAYRIYKSLYESSKIDKWKILEFLNDNALPTYNFAIESDKKNRKYRKAIQTYEKLHAEFTSYLADLALATKNELDNKKDELKSTESNLKQKEFSERKLLIEKIKLTGNLEKKELEKLALSDSLLQADLALKEKALRLMQAQAKTETAEKEKALADAQAFRNKVNTYIAVAALSLALLFGMYFFWNLRKSRKMNKVLREQKQELKLQNEEINQQKEEIITQRDNIEMQNVALQQHKEEIEAQRDNIQEQNIILQQQKEEIQAQRDYLAELNDEIATERDKSDKLLLNILPSETAKELKAYGKAKPRFYEMGTVMFTDFKGFTQIAEKLTPEQIVQELNRCFQAFDEIIEKYDMEKIKTMGDGYLCAGGIPVPNKTNPIDAVKAGLAMLEFMEEVKKEKIAKNEPIWNLRVGIHTGPLVAGVIGKNRFAYDIWGDTVNVASRMESSGEPGKVNISGDTYELVKSYFNCAYRGKVFAKNKGEIDMYFVEGRSSFFQSFQNLNAQA
jgi:class 3 adenylate cyclase